MNQDNFEASVKEVLNRAFQYYWAIVRKLGSSWDFGTKDHPGKDELLRRTINKITKKKT